MHNILEHSRKARTIREIATIVYGMPHPPKDTAEFIKLLKLPTPKQGFAP